MNIRLRKGGFDLFMGNEPGGAGLNFGGSVHRWEIDWEWGGSRSA